MIYSSANLEYLGVECVYQFCGSGWVYLLIFVVYKSDDFCDLVSKGVLH